MFSSHPSQAAEIYVIEGPRGSVTFSGKKPTDGRKYRVIRSKSSSPKRSKLIVHKGGRVIKARKSKYDAQIISIAKEFAVEPALVKAVAHIESAFRYKAVSPKGAQGLMQLMPATAKRLNVSDAFDPEQNLRGGTKYLQKLLILYRGNEELALAAYNAGEKAVEKYGGIPPFPETRAYVRNVLYARNLYRRGGFGR